MSKGKLLPFEMRDRLHELPGAKLAVWLSYWLHSDKQGIAWPSLALTAKETGLNRDYVKQTKTELLRSGWLRYGADKQPRLSGSKFGVRPCVAIVAPVGIISPHGGNLPTENFSPDRGVNFTPLSTTEKQYIKPPSPDLQASLSSPHDGKGSTTRKDAQGNAHSPSAEEEAAVRRVWDYYIRTFEKNPNVLTLTRLRNRKGISALRVAMVKTRGDLGKGEELLDACVDEMAATPWNMGKNPEKQRHDLWETFLFPNQEKLEDWIDRALNRR